MGAYPLYPPADPVGMAQYEFDRKWSAIRGAMREMGIVRSEEDKAESRKMLIAVGLINPELDKRGRIKCQKV